MITNTQTKNMNALIIDFLTEHGSEDMVEMWQRDYQEKLMAKKGPFGSFKST